MDFQQIIAGTVGKENTYGTCVGKFTDDPLDTFGGAGVVHIPRMQELLRYICEQGFEHHLAANLAKVGGAVHEATSRYMGWTVHAHN
jgi:L-fucose isomerase-like protein